MSTVSTHLFFLPTQINTTAPLIQAETPAENNNVGAMDLPEPPLKHLPEEQLLAASTDVPTEPKLKQKRKNDTHVCFSTLIFSSLTEHFSFQSQNYKSGSRFEMPPLKKSYAMMDWRTISDTNAVMLAIFSLVFTNAQIAQVGVDSDAIVVLLRCTKRCTE